MLQIIQNNRSTLRHFHHPTTQHAESDAETECPRLEELDLSRVKGASEVVAAIVAGRLPRLHRLAIATALDYVDYGAVKLGSQRNERRPRSG